jgi:hypothetical protein
MILSGDSFLAIMLETDLVSSWPGYGIMEGVGETFCDRFCPPPKVELSLSKVRHLLTISLS